MTATLTRTDELLDEVAAYADRLADSDRLADTGSMVTAEALAELYEKREWVAEWLEQKPIKEKSSYIGGRPPEPDSRNRFSQWLVWKQEQRKRHAVQSRTLYQLLNAHEVKGYLRQAQITSERVLRPLDWMRSHRFPQRIPEVWDRAVDLAGDADYVTSAHTRQALAEWKKEVLGTAGYKAAVTTKRAETHRLKAQGAISTLMADGDQEEIDKFKRWLRDQLDGAK
jgi:hypothetical protein